jgi:2-dehydropantoate 2-reductase
VSGTIGPDPQRIAVVGCGAIGGLLAARWIAAGLEVAVVDRPSTIRAIRTDGIRLTDLEGATHAHAPAQAATRCDEMGPVDLVVLAVKAHQIAEVAPHLPALYGPQTMVVTVQNGLPWWYFEGLDIQRPAPAGTRLDSLDPDGVIAHHVPADRIVGCVAYPAVHLAAPGQVVHVEGDRFPIGELSGEITPRLEAVGRTFERGGFRTRLLDDIRSELWLKAWGALAFNPMSVLTGETMAGMARFGPTREVLAAAMREAQAIGEALGAHFRVPLERRLAGAEAVGEHKTSMLQDYEAGRSMEIEAVAGVICELGRRTGIPSPTIDALYACVALINRGFEDATEASASSVS